MELGMEKCAMLITRREKREITEEIELLTQEIIKTLGEKKIYMYLGLLEVDIIKEAEMKEK